MTTLVGGLVVLAPFAWAVLVCREVARGSRCRVLRERALR